MSGRKPAFEGQRPPFAPGNTVAVRHGFYSAFVVEGKASEFAEILWQIAPAASAADAPSIGLAANALARAHFADRALAELEERLDHSPLSAALKEELARVRQDARSARNQAWKFCDGLGLNAPARVRLGISLQQLQPLDAGRITPAERAELTRILTKMGATVPELTSGA